LIVVLIHTAQRNEKRNEWSVKRAYVGALHPYSCQFIHTATLTPGADILLAGLKVEASQLA
jgi:hypothetical protein